MMAAGCVALPPAASGNRAGCGSRSGPPGAEMAIPVPKAIPSIASSGPENEADWNDR